MFAPQPIFHYHYILYSISLHWGFHVFVALRVWEYFHPDLYVRCAWFFFHLVSSTSKQKSWMERYKFIFNKRPLRDRSCSSWLIILMQKWQKQKRWKKRTTGRKRTANNRGLNAVITERTKRRKYNCMSHYNDTTEKITAPFWLLEKASLRCHPARLDFFLQLLWKPGYTGNGPWSLDLMITAGSIIKMEMKWA